MAHAVVTGANRGIGLELCKQLAARGERVTAACRHASDALSALDVDVVEGFDVTDEASLEKLQAHLSATPVDLVINSAGILRRETLSALDIDSIRAQFEVNALGPLRVTAALRDCLARPAKVAIITSRMGSIADNTSGSRYGYRMSKAAVNMAGMSLSHDLRSQDVSIAILHPGFVQTDMTGGAGDVSVEGSVRGLLARIDELTPQTSGTFWHAQGQVLPW
jgi:NAD(P)-dependent dehydrogenase (short-subunit alcohol dehydrogenase family)